MSKGKQTSLRLYHQPTQSSKPTRYPLRLRHRLSTTTRKNNKYPTRHFYRNTKYHRPKTSRTKAPTLPFNQTSKLHLPNIPTRNSTRSRATRLPSKQMPRQRPNKFLNRLSKQPIHPTRPKAKDLHKKFPSLNTTKQHISHRKDSRPTQYTSHLRQRRNTSPQPYTNTNPHVYHQKHRNTKNDKAQQAVGGILLQVSYDGAFFNFRGRPPSRPPGPSLSIIRPPRSLSN